MAEPPSKPPTEEANNSDNPPPILPDSPRGSVLWRLRGALRTVRPHQWVKNTFVLAPVVFSKYLTHESIILSAIGGFGVFCLVSGAVYILNDLVDVEADRVHPVKRKRPIASGQLPVPWAYGLLVFVLAIASIGAALGPWKFAACVGLYFVLNVAYSLKLKKIAYLDVALLSFFFVLRVLAGGFAVRVVVSDYLIACTALLALFLGFGKRRHELAGANAGKQRAALEQYSPRSLTIALAVTGVASVATYLAYTLDAGTEAFFNSNLLWLTTIHPIFGLLRFLQLVVGRPKSESPTQEMLRDVPFVVNLALWGVEIAAIVYRLRPT